MIQDAYSELFALHEEDSWSLGKDALITFFRAADASSAIVGERQANTFTALASLAGYGAKPEPRAQATRPRANTAASRAPKSASTTHGATNGTLTKSLSGPTQPNVGFSVRIEINLPATNDQDVYDKIFRSLRTNLIDAPAGA
jgi:hypothetical protein